MIAIMITPSSFNRSIFELRFKLFLEISFDLFKTKKVNSCRTVIISTVA